LANFSRGLLQVTPPPQIPPQPQAVGPRIAWGRQIDTTALPDLYAPQKIEPFRATPGGIDNLNLSSTDTFVIPGLGQFDVDFKGYFRVARENPTTKDWATCDVYVNMLDLRLIGNSKDFGEIRVKLNPDVLSAGQVFHTGSAKTEGDQPLGQCRIATSVTFEIPSLKLITFNKEPILLMNGGIRSIPPVEDPNGEAHIYYLPLFDMNGPNSNPAAYLSRLRYTVGNYIGKDEAEILRQTIT
jgi:hypothetical protein